MKSRLGTALENRNIGRLWNYSSQETLPLLREERPKVTRRAWLLSVHRRPQPPNRDAVTLAFLLRLPTALSNW